MTNVLKTLAAAAILATATTIAAVAAPPHAGQPADGVRSSVIQVHGNHRSCERSRSGWHRHNRFGERRTCRRWDGRGQRPDACVRVGPVWFCDY